MAHHRLRGRRPGPGYAAGEQVLHPESSGPLDVVVQDLLGTDAGAAVAMGSTSFSTGCSRGPADGFSGLREEAARLVTPPDDVAEQRPDALDGGGAGALDASRRGSPDGPEAVVVGSGAAGSAVAWELARRAGTSPSSNAGRNLQPGLGKVPAASSTPVTAAPRSRGRVGFRAAQTAARAVHHPDAAEGGAGHRPLGEGALGQLGCHCRGNLPALQRGRRRGSGTRTSPSSPTSVRWTRSPTGRSASTTSPRSTTWSSTGWGSSVHNAQQRTLGSCQRRRQFGDPPNTTGHAASLVAEVRRLGFEAYPTRQRSTPGPSTAGPPATRAACGFGALRRPRRRRLVSWLNPAMRTGQGGRHRPACVHRIEYSRNGRRARAVHWTDVHGRRAQAAGHHVLLAGSPINTARLLLLFGQRPGIRGLGNRFRQVGRNMMFHNFTLAAALYAEDIKRCARARRCRSTTWSGRSRRGSALGVPYVASSGPGRVGDTCRWGPRRCWPGWSATAAPQAADEGGHPGRPGRS